MEVQAIHVKDNKKYSYLHEAAADKSVLILSYLFEVIDFEFLFIFSFVFSPLTYSVVYDINVSIYLPSLLDILKLRDASDVTRYYLINDWHFDQYYITVFVFWRLPRNPTSTERHQLDFPVPWYI